MLSHFYIQYLTKLIEVSSIKYQVLPYHTMFEVSSIKYQVLRDQTMFDVSSVTISDNVCRHVGLEGWVLVLSQQKKPCLHTRRRMLEGIITLNLK